MKSSQMNRNKHSLAIGTIVLVIDNKGRILLHRQENDLWDLPGGLIKSGERIEVTSRKQVWKLTGVRIRELELIGSYVDTSNKYGMNPVLTAIYLTKNNHDVFRLIGVSTIKGQYFELSKFPKNLSQRVPIILEKVMNGGT